MTTIAQMDQLITSLQNIRATLAEGNGQNNTGDFGAMFDTALSNALEEPVPQMNVNAAAMVNDSPAQSFDDFMAMNLLGTVCRQGFWDQWRPKLRESLAHLVG